MSTTTAPLAASCNAIAQVPQGRHRHEGDRVWLAWHWAGSSRSSPSCG